MKKPITRYPLPSLKCITNSGKYFYLDYPECEIWMPQVANKAPIFGTQISQTMSDRKKLNEADPKAFQTMMGFEKYLAETSLTKTDAELIKIRVSQINGCSFCIDKHIKDALKYGEDPRRIFLLTAWRETNLFTVKERAILALVEEMTLIHRHGVTDEVYNNALEALGQTYLTEVMMGIIAMNAWNRVGITTGRIPE